MSPTAYGILNLNPKVTEENKYERFENWLRENGGRFEMLELREYSTSNVPIQEEINEYETSVTEEKKEPSSTFKTQTSEGSSEMRGVHGKVTIPPNSICMLIPRKCLITVEMGQATEIGQAILNSDLELDAPKHIFLMIFLLCDMRKEDSFFKPYYNILPSTLKNMPIFWSKEELDYLQGSYLLAQIADRNEAIEDDYHAICEVAPALSDIATLDEFKWARMCVCSRNFGLQIDGNRTSALVPHADMLNHYRPRETKWTFDDERQAFTITTLQMIPCGAQVYDSYGQKCNHRFLLNYGFAVENNREVDGFCPNEVPIELGILPDDFLFESKYDFWISGESNHQIFDGRRYSDKSSLPLVKRVRVCVSNNENTRILFSMLRVIVADETELHAITNNTHPFATATNNAALTRAVLGFTTAASSSPPPPSPSTLYRTCRDIRCPISFRNERAAMKHLLNVTHHAICLYPTTYEQDIEALLDERLYPRFSTKRHAKIQVRGEKEVLLHFANWARTALQVMDVIEYDLNNDFLDTPCQFDETIRAMEEDDEKRIHHTIVRYCADVLGALKREERKRRKKMAVNSISGPIIRTTHSGTHTGKFY